MVRGPKREVISRCYNLLLRVTLGGPVLRRAVRVQGDPRLTQARELLPLVADTGWFFDTELLVLAERAGLRIHEVPVDWIDDADSRVDIVATALDDLRGVARVGWGLARGRLTFRCCGRPRPVRGARGRRSGADEAAAQVRGDRRAEHGGYVLLYPAVRRVRRGADG